MSLTHENECATTHVCISIDNKKRHLTKFNSLHDWNSQHISNRMELPQLIKGIYKNSQPTSYLVVKDWKLLLKSEKKQECLFPPLHFDIGLEIQGRTIRQERKWGIHLGKKEVNYFCLQVAMPYIENPKQSTKNPCRTNKWVQQAYSVKDQYPKNQPYFYKLSISNLKMKLRK